jgi:hypothetical protein
MAKVILHMLEIITSKSEVIKIGNKFDLYQHGLETRILITIVLVLNRQRRFNKKIKEIKPDIIHLHHLHGYFINIEILFQYKRM